MDERTKKIYADLLQAAEPHSRAFRDFDKLSDDRITQLDTEHSRRKGKVFAARMGSAWKRVQAEERATKPLCRATV